MANFFVLVVVFMYGHGHSLSVSDFRDKAICEAAALQIEEQHATRDDKGAVRYKHARATCLRVR